MTLGLFEAVGIEIEEMIVDAATLSPLPLADLVLMEEGGAHDDAVRGAVTWSNELVLHVLEMKTSGPAPSFAGLAAAFEESVARMHAILAPRGARMLGTGMHPFMDPATERRLWPHGNGEIYAAFDRIFDARGHGWSNVQSVHLNLPFAGDAEFARLHDAIRVVLPILPALAAASPAAEGRLTGFLDTRLEHYRTNSARIPSVTGHVVPERVSSEEEYRERILGPIYADMAPHDPEGLLRDEWANARGAIARFDRDAIEIRLLDAQECPRADLAVAAAVTGAVRSVIDRDLPDLHERALEPILRACMKDGSRTEIADPAFLRTLGWTGAVPCRAGDLWRHLVDVGFRQVTGADELRPTIDGVLRNGTLAERIVAAGPDLRATYIRLANCLRDGTVFG